MSDLVKLLRGMAFDFDRHNEIDSRDACRSAADEIERLSGVAAIRSIDDLGPVEAGSVLAVTLPEYAEPPAFQTIKRALAQKIGHEDFAVIGLAEGATLDLLTEDDMARIGWVRAEPTCGHGNDPSDCEPCAEEEAQEARYWRWLVDERGTTPPNGGPNGHAIAADESRASGSSGGAA